MDMGLKQGMLAGTALKSNETGCSRSCLHAAMLHIFRSGIELQKRGWSCKHVKVPKCINVSTHLPLKHRSLSSHWCKL